MTRLAALLSWLATWPGAVWLQQSETAYLLVNATHILGVGLLIGSILPLDIRLIGLIRAEETRFVAPLLIRTASVGLTLAALTGFWLFTVKPHEYVQNSAFLIKASLLALALVNIVAQHSTTSFNAALRGEGERGAVKVLASLSAILWLSVLVAGRWIGFIAT